MYKIDLEYASQDSPTSMEPVKICQVCDGCVIVLERVKNECSNEDQEQTYSGSRSLNYGQRRIEVEVLEGMVSDIGVVFPYTVVTQALIFSVSSVSVTFYTT